ncbi:hypothetical protein PTKIN_Ptkin05aG0089200 [Pterospermum kingtungense]
MAKKLKGAWRLLTITDEEKDVIKTSSLQPSVDLGEEKGWLMAKLFIKRPFNREAMIGTFRVGRNIRLRVKIDITKPLRRFVTVVSGGGKDDIWARLGYERLPLLYYSYGKLGHGEFECDSVDDPVDDSGVKQYGEWL